MLLQSTTGIGLRVRGMSLLPHWINASFVPKL
eukprot:COSAG02_NODE_17168_length_1023_cov_19.655844_2_plen_31_part_01